MKQTEPYGVPPIESIIPEAIEKTDVGYSMGVHMHGLRGAWHRLWAMLVLQATMGGADDGIDLVRGQVSQALGRPMTDDELSRLVDHATQHAAKVHQHFGGST